MVPKIRDRVRVIGIVVVDNGFAFGAPVIMVEVTYCNVFKRDSSFENDLKWGTAVCTAYFDFLAAVYFSVDACNFWYAV